MSNTISIINPTTVSPADEEVTISGTPSGGYTREEIRNTELRRISYSWN